MITRFKNSINVWRVAVGYITLTMLFVCVEYTVLRSLPLSAWIKYDQVTVFRPVEGGGPIKALSIIHRYRNSDMIYNDKLFCRGLKERKFNLYSTQNGHYSGAPASDKVLVSNWTYTASVPRRESVCFIESTVTVQLRYGIMPKAKPIRTQPFFVENSKWLKRRMEMLNGKDT